MKSNEARERMVERVQAAYAKWPSLGQMPTAKGDYLVSVNEALLAVEPGKAYVEALYAAAYRGEPVGRLGTSIAVKKVEERPI